MNFSNFPFKKFNHTHIAFSNRESIETSYLEIKGPDAQRFLNGQLTSDVDALESCSFQQSARLDRTGRVKSFFILAKKNDKEFLAIGEKELIDFLKEDLDKYIIMDDVELNFKNNELSLVFSYSGPKSFLFNGIYGGLPCYILESNDIEGKALSEKEYRDLALLRGIPLLNLNVALDQLVTDTILNLNSVSHKKGCYLGQETVSKIESRRGGAHFPILVECDERFPHYTLGENIYVNEERMGKVLGATEFEGRKFLLISSVRKFRVDQMRMHLDDVSSRVHYIPFGGDFSHDEWVNHLYEEGVKVFHQESVEKALPIFKEILEIVPNHEDALETIGVIYGQLGDFEKGISLMDEVLEANPDSIMAHTNKSLFYMKMGKIEEAEEEKAQATVKSFSMFGKEAQAKKAQEEKLESEIKELERREEMFKQVLEIDPEDTLANFGMGDIYFKKAKFDEARQALESVLSADSKYSVAYVLLSKTYLKLNDEDAAKKTLKKGIEQASLQGDLMPANEMQQILNNLE